MPVLFWIDIAALALSGLIAAALSLAVLGSAPRRNLNLTFCLFTSMAALWAGFSLLFRLSLWLQRGNAVLLSELAAWAISFMGPLLLVFTTRYVCRRRLREDLIAVLGMAVTAALGLPLLQHRLVFNPQIKPNGSTTLDLSPLGLAMAAIPALFILWSLILFLRERRRTGEPFLALSVLTFLTGFLVGGVLELDFPVLSITNTVSVFLLGYGVVSRQLFNPLKQLTQDLERKVEQRTRELEEAYAQVTKKIEYATAELRQEITERNKAEKEIRARAALLELIGGVGRATTRILNLDELLRRAVMLIRENFRYNNISILLVEGDYVVLRATALPAFREHEGKIKLRVGVEGITGMVAAQSESLLIPDVTVDARYRGVTGAYETRSELAVPIRFMGKSIGVLDSQSTEINDFSQVDVFTLQTVADQLAIAIENAGLYEEARQRAELLQRELAERKRTEEVLRDSEEKFRNLAEESPNMIFINMGGRVVYANLQCQAFMGYSREELYDPGFDFLSLIAPEYRDLVMANYRQQMKGNDIPPYEYALTTKNGTRMDAIITTRLIRYDGQNAILGIVTDISKRKRSEKMLQMLNAAALAMERALTEAEIFATAGDTLLMLDISCAVFLVDRQNGTLGLAHCNYGARIATELQKQTGMPVQAFCIGLDRASIFHRASRTQRAVCIDPEDVIRTHFPDLSPLQARKMTGLLRLTRSMAAPLITEDDTVGLLLVHSRDLVDEDGPAIVAFAHQMAAAWRKTRLMQDLQGSLHELERTQEQLVQSQKIEAIGQLAGGIAHDFNNLLTAINGYTELLLSDLASDSLMRADVEGIKRASTRAANLTRQLLAFGRKQMLQPKILSLNSVVTGLGKMLQRLIGENIELILALDANLLMVKADPSQIEQVLMNLVINARDAMPLGGRLTLQTENVILDKQYSLRNTDVLPGLYSMVAVSDTGAGMSEDTLGHLFEPFFTTKKDGSGLGLSSVYGIIKQSGGHIAVHSEQDKGSVFSVYLPAVEEQAEPLRPDEQEGRPHPHQGTERILVVEDEDMVRDLTQRLLAKMGYTVLTARNAAAALRISFETSAEIHLLISDIVMPGRMNGWELARHLTQSRPNMGVLLVSGYADRERVGPEGLENGVAFLQKPYTAQVLFRRIRELLEKPGNAST